MSEILDIAIDKVRLSESAFCRFITANDTGKNGSNQAGYYIPKCAGSLLFNGAAIRGENKHRYVTVKWQNDFITNSRFIYYGKAKNEYRITCLGKNFPFMEEDNVGDLLIIAKENEEYYNAFVLGTDQDIDDFFAYFNLSSESTNQLIDISNTKNPGEKLLKLFEEFLSRYSNFPDTINMAKYAQECYNQAYLASKKKICNDPDKFLLGWTDSEYSLFRYFEEKIYKDVYSTPFTDCQSLIDFANSILNRRKSRAGKSLEHHLATIFRISELEFEEQVVTEDNKKPDFIFPGGEAYHNLLFPAEDLIFLGAKTTCKDRWRQVLNEANRIEMKYLFTLQQGVSKNQLKEMQHEHLTLVVPDNYRKSFDKEFRANIETLASFIQIVKRKQDSRKIYVI